MLVWPTWYAEAPLVRWFLTWAHNLGTAGRAASPGAACRDAQAEDEASPGWRAQRRVRRDYANVGRDCCDCGDEDALGYCPSPCASEEPEVLAGARERTRIRLSVLARLHLVRGHLASTPAIDAARRHRLLAERAQLLTIAVRFACGGPGDGPRLSFEASAALIRTIFGIKQSDR